MKQTKRERLEKKGWKVGSVSDFLELSPEEEAFVELRLALSHSVREKRKEQSLTQEQLAGQIGSSQSRVAKIEAGNESVSLDLLIRSLFSLGISMKELSEIIAKIPRPKQSQGSRQIL